MAKQTHKGCPLVSPSHVETQTPTSEEQAAARLQPPSPLSGYRLPVADHAAGRAAQRATARAASVTACLRRLLSEDADQNGHGAGAKALARTAMAIARGETPMRADGKPMSKAEVASAARMIEWITERVDGAVPRHVTLQDETPAKRVILQEHAEPRTPTLGPEKGDSSSSEPSSSPPRAEPEPGS